MQGRRWNAAQVSTRATTKVAIGGAGAVALALVVASCSSTPANTTTGTSASAGATSPSTTAAATTGTSAPGATTGTGGTTPGTGGTTSGSATPGSVVVDVAEGECPDETRIEFYPESESGSKGRTDLLEAEASWADVTLGSSVTVALANYALEAEDADAIGAPTLGEGEVQVSFYLSAANGKKLAPGTYEGFDGDFQFNTHFLYTAEGRVIANGFGIASPVATITKIDDTEVCGTVRTGEYQGVFRAEVTP